MKRISPVRMPLKAKKTREINHFEVVTAYHDETRGPLLVDLSHVAKWEIETADLDERMNDLGLTVPGEPCKAFLSDDRAISRLTPTRALVWDFHDTADNAWTQSRVCNDLTDGTALLFMAGKDLLSVMERLTSLNLNLEKKPHPLFLQGPVLGVPAKILVDINMKHQMGMFISVGRGFGQSMAEAILSAGEEEGLSPAGEHVFSQWSGK